MSLTRLVRCQAPELTNLASHTRCRERKGPQYDRHTRIHGTPVCLERQGTLVVSACFFCSPHPSLCIDTWIAPRSELASARASALLSLFLAREHSGLQLEPSRAPRSVDRSPPPQIPESDAWSEGKTVWQWSEGSTLVQNLQLWSSAWRNKSPWEPHPLFVATKAWVLVRFPGIFPVPSCPSTHMWYDGGRAARKGVVESSTGICMTDHKG